MKTKVAVFLCIVLVACSTVSPGGEAERPAAMATTEAPTPAGTERPSPAMPGDSVLLSRWNEDAGRHEIVPVDPATGEALPDFRPLATGAAAVGQGGHSCEAIAGGDVHGG